VAKKRDELTEAEVASRRGPYYEPGRPYRWILSFGWVVTGFYITHQDPLTIRVAHANYTRNAGTDWGAFAVEGAPETCDWKYEGEDLLYIPHIQRVSEYHGEVPRGRIVR
jgi:hypothetical protein